MSTVDVAVDDFAKKPLTGRRFITGTQAPYIAARLILNSDKTLGRNTRFVVTGYPGSPLAAMALKDKRLKKFLKAQGIDYFDALNERAAVNFVRGRQHLNKHRRDKVDGVPAIAFMKAPGFYQTGDDTDQANTEGSHEWGGVCYIIGDDSSGSSTTTWAKSEKKIEAFRMAALAPSYVGEIAEFIAKGIQLSRHSGLFSAVPITSELAESWGVVDLDRLLHDMKIAYPEKPRLNLNPLYSRHDVGRLQRARLDAAERFVDANFFNHSDGWDGGDNPRLGIAAPGVSYAHVRQALYELGISEAKAKELGIRLLKVGAPTLISERTARDFAKGLDEILVVEELEPLVEDKLRQKLYGGPDHPLIFGKRNPLDNSDYVPETAHDAAKAAKAIADRILAFTDDPDIRQRAQYIEQRVKDTNIEPIALRHPFLCPGCPHLLSTEQVEGSFTSTGTGCHTLLGGAGLSIPGSEMAARSEIYHPMGSAGCVWAGQAEFSSVPHNFQNVGDGSLFHGDIQGVRAAVDFYKQGLPGGETIRVLHNKTVAMTGGQDLPGNAGPVEIAKALYGSGVEEMSIATAGDWRYRLALRFRLKIDLPLKLHVRVLRYDQIKKEEFRLQKIPGVTALIADKECATERRRKWARGTRKKPDRRVFVNEQVCEGCGDCTKKSGGCSAVEYVKTEFGDKAHINTTTCNLDMGCLSGFCPSLVSVEGKLRRVDPANALKNLELQELKEPETVSPLGDHRSILAPGIGGQGATLVGRLLGWATYIQSLQGGDSAQLACLGYDATGLAQKSGPVTSNFILGTVNSEGVHTAKISTGQDSCADLVLALDAVNASQPGNLNKIGPKTVVIVNEGQEPVVQAKEKPELRHRDAEVLKRIEENTTNGNFYSFNASAMSEALTGNRMATNTVMLGYAYQKGLVPLSLEALTQAIELNGVAVKDNLLAFEWGRRCAVQPEIVGALTNPVWPERPLSETLDQKIEARVQRLTEFRDAAYAATYREIVERVRGRDRELGRNDDKKQRLTAAVADGLFDVMYNKDEYEVARLYRAREFRDALDKQFERGYKVTYTLAPPSLERMLKSGIGKKLFRDGKIGLPGIIAQPMFRALTEMQKHGVRGTIFDPFRNLKDRNLDREIRDYYEKTVIGEILGTDNNAAEYARAVTRARDVPKGFGHIKEKNFEQVLERAGKQMLQELVPA